MFSKKTTILICVILVLIVAGAVYDHRQNISNILTIDIVASECSDLSNGIEISARSGSASNISYSTDYGNLSNEGTGIVEALGGRSINVYVDSVVTWLPESFDNNAGFKTVIKVSAIKGFSDVVLTKKVQITFGADKIYRAELID